MCDFWNSPGLKKTGYIWVVVRNIGFFSLYITAHVILFSHTACFRDIRECIGGVFSSHSNAGMPELEQHYPPRDIPRYNECPNEIYTCGRNLGSLNCKEELPTSDHCYTNHCILAIAKSISILLNIPITFYHMQNLLCLENDPKGLLVAYNIVQWCRQSSWEE